MCSLYNDFQILSFGHISPYMAFQFVFGRFRGRQLSLWVFTLLQFHTVILHLPGISYAWLYVLDLPAFIKLLFLLSYCLHFLSLTGRIVNTKCLKVFYVANE